MLNFWTPAGLAASETTGESCTRAAFACRFGTLSSLGLRLLTGAGPLSDARCQASATRTQRKLGHTAKSP